MKRIISTIISAFFMICCAGQEKMYSIQIRLKSEDGTALSSASVSIPSLNRQFTADSTGGLTITGLTDSSVTVHISSVGFSSLSATIHPSENDTVFEFILKKDIGAMTGVSVFGYTPVQRVNRQAYNVNAIDAEKLHNTSYDISQVLNRVPGARLRETGGVGSDFEFSLNGFSGKRIKFFLDGVPLDNFGPAFQINNIPVSLAQRIEVYKGVVPVWLGSDALGGAVNIITANRTKNYLEVSQTYGSFNTHRTNLNAALTTKKGLTFQLNAYQNYSDNDYQMTVDAADIRTGRYYPNSKVRRFHDQYRNKTAIFKIGFVEQKWADVFLLGLTAGDYYKEIQTGARIDAVYGAWHTKGNILMPTLRYEKKDLFTKGLTFRLSGNYNFGKDQNIDTVHARYGWFGDSENLSGRGGELAYSYYIYRNNSANIASTAMYDLGKKHYLSLNNTFSYFDRKGVNPIPGNSAQYEIPQKTNKNITGLSYQYTGIDNWSMTVFAKYLTQRANTTLIETSIANPTDTVFNNVNLHNQKIGYGFATTYFFKPELQVKLSLEKANRLPESEDLFGDLINKEGNWDLKPETSTNINLGLNYTFSFGNNRLYVGATGIYNYANDYIYYAFNDIENRITAKNLFKVSTTGIESELRYSFRNLFSVGANVTYQNIRDRQPYRVDLPPGVQIKSATYKERIPNIPYLFGNMDATLYLKDLLQRHDKFTIGYSLLYVHDFFLYWRQIGAVNTKRTIPEQFSHDVNFLYSLKDGRYNIGLECRNISDRRLYDNFSLQKPGRSFYLKFRYFLVSNK